MHEVMLEKQPLAALAALLPAGQAARFEAAAVHIREVLAGRVVWNVSATEMGGGVAEMLHTLLGYLLAAGVEARWLVLDGDEQFCVAWRSHIGRDAPNEQSVAGWEFLRRYIQEADALIFSRRQHAPAWIPPERLWIIPPSIDPLAAKNRPMEPGEPRRVLARAGLLAINGARRLPPSRGPLRPRRTPGWLCRSAGGID